MPRESPDAPEDLPKEAPGQVTFGQLPNQSHSGSPIESQCGDVTGLFSRRLSPCLLDSVGAARAAGGELLLGVLGAVPAGAEPDSAKTKPAGRGNETGAKMTEQGPTPGVLASFAQVRAGCPRSLDRGSDPARTPAIAAST